MVDQVEIINNDAEARVALDLADSISNNEDLMNNNDFRKKYLDLYAECLRVVKYPEGRLKEER